MALFNRADGFHGCLTGLLFTIADQFLQGLQTLRGAYLLENRASLALGFAVPLVEQSQHGFFCCRTKIIERRRHVLIPHVAATRDQIYKRLDGALIFEPT